MDQRQKPNEGRQKKIVRNQESATVAKITLINQSIASGYGRINAYVHLRSKVLYGAFRHLYLGWETD